MPKLINGLAFEISAPYSEGHIINEAEARVLNQTRAENIGNNLRAKIKELADAGQSLEEIQAVVSEKDAEYIFTLSNVGESRKMDPVEREAVKIARELLKQHLGETGRKLGTAPEGVTEDEWKEKIEAEVDRISQSEQVVAAARKRVDMRKKQADSLMDALGGVTV